MSDLRWTETAVEQLAAIHAYVAQTSEVYADRLIERRRDRLNAVPAMPEAGRIVPEYRDPSIREVFEGVYRLIYAVRRDAVFVPAVVHGRRDGIPEIGEAP